MNKEILKKALIQAWYFLLAYLKSYLVPSVIEALQKTKEYFISTLWDTVKEDIYANLHSSITFVEEFLESSTYEEKEKAVLDNLFQKVQLPLLLRPFKSVIKSMLKGKLKQLIHKKLQEFEKGLPF